MKNTIETYNIFLNKILIEWKIFFETVDEAYNFLIRIQKKFYSNCETFRYDKFKFQKNSKKLEGIYMQFVSQN